MKVRLTSIDYTFRWCRDGPLCCSRFNRAKYRQPTKDAECLAAHMIRHLSYDCGQTKLKTFRRGESADENVRKRLCVLDVLYAKNEDAVSFTAVIVKLAVAQADEQKRAENTDAYRELDDGFIVRRAPAQKSSDGVDLNLLRRHYPPQLRRPSLGHHVSEEWNQYIKARPTHEKQRERNVRHCKQQHRDV